MDAELQKALASILNRTVSAAEAGAYFLQKELPEVIQQLLAWKAAEAGVIAIVLALACAFSFAIWWKNREWAWEELGPLNLLAWALTGGLLFFSLAYSLTVLKIIIAPKVFLIEFAASLAK